MKRILGIICLCLLLGACSNKIEGFVVDRFENGNRFYLTVELQDGSRKNVEVTDKEYIGLENGDPLIFDAADIAP